MGEGWGGGEISNMAETQPPSRPSPCQREGVFLYLLGNNGKYNFEIGSNE